MTLSEKWNRTGVAVSPYINPAYVKAIEEFAKRAAEGVLLYWVDAMEWQCNFCHRSAMPREKKWECEHTPDCIVLAAQEYLKVKE